MNDPHLFQTFADSLLRAAVNVRQYDVHSCKFHISTFVTNSDEAFVFLNLVNAYDNWMSKAKEKIEGVVSQENHPATKWTRNASKARRGEGWALVAQDEFNNLMDKVHAERALPTSEDLEKNIMKAKKEKNKKNKYRNRMMQGIAALDHPVRHIKDDLTDDEGQRNNSAGPGVPGMFNNAGGTYTNQPFFYSGEDDESNGINYNYQTNNYQTEPI